MKSIKNQVIILIILISVFGINLKLEAQKIPPGTVEYSDNLFVDRYEIRNIDWREYMYWNLKKYGIDSEEYIAVLPDTLVWDNAMKSKYLRHPNYGNYPVVGISYHQAKAYCKWRTKVVNIFIYMKETKQEYCIDSTYEEAPQIFTYRLPTISEWEDISRIPRRKFVERKIKRKGYPRGNFRPKDRVNMSKVKTKPVGYGFKTKLGIYNIFGNVAEITAKRDVAKGGSWEHFEEQCIPESGFSYSKPTNWLGFRCVCEKTVPENEEKIKVIPNSQIIEP